MKTCAYSTPRGIPRNIKYLLIPNYIFIGSKIIKTKIIFIVNILSIVSAVDFLNIK